MRQSLGCKVLNWLTVATRDEGDFAHFDVAVLNPFQYRAP